MPPKKQQKWNEQAIVESSNKLHSLFGKLFRDSTVDAEDESKSSIEQMISEIALMNCKRLNEMNQLSFRGMLTVLEIEYCTKNQTIQSSAANGMMWRQIFQTDTHFFHFVRNFLSEIGLLNGSTSEAGWTEDLLGSLVVELSAKLQSTDKQSVRQLSDKDIALFNKGDSHFNSKNDTKKHKLFTSKDFISLDISACVAASDDGSSQDQNQPEGADMNVVSSLFTSEEVGVLRAIAQYKAFPYALFCDGKVKEMWMPFKCMIEK